MQRTANLREMFGFAKSQLYRKRKFHSKRSTTHMRNGEEHKWQTVPYARLGVFLAGAAAIGYDGIVNNFTYCGASVRFLRSVKTATLIAIDYLALSKADPQYDTNRKEVHRRSATRLLDTCLLNGGLYIKIGQGVAAINHILPIEYTSILSKLQDECYQTTKADVQKVFRNDFGQVPEEIYQEFEYSPVAAASLAQVFKAKLHSGEQVAVKVQYNDLQKRFVSDLATIVFLEDIIELVFKDYNFGWILNDLQKNLVHELNFVNEGQNAERCANDLRNLRYVHVPKIHWSHTKTRVLTMEWMDGYKISNMDDIRNQNLSLTDIDMKLYTVFAEQIFHSGFVHADPHPGNIFVRKDGQDGKAQIILLDHGLYEELPSDVRKPLCEFWEATVLRDERRMKAAAQKLNVTDYMKFAEVLFQQPIKMHGGRIRSKLTQKDIEHVQKVARENFHIIMNTLKEMPRSLLFVVRNLNTVRAIGNMHGDVVDRPCVMARHAQHCVCNNGSSRSVKYLRWLNRRIYLEYRLWESALRLRLINWYFNLLYLVGRAPASARTLMRDIMKQDKEIVN